MEQEMKIKITRYIQIDVHGNHTVEIEPGTIVTAIVSEDKTCAVFFIYKNHSWMLFNNDFEIVYEPTTPHIAESLNQKITDPVLQKLDKGMRDSFREIFGQDIKSVEFK